MRTTNHTARGLVPLAVLLLMLAWTSWTVMGEGALHIDQTISPSEIYVVGRGGEDDATSTTLSLSIAAPANFPRYPIDCLLLIDVSETSDLTDAKMFAHGLIDQLGVNDRIGLISYATTAELDMPMTHNVGAVKLAVDDLTNGGRSAMGLAMQMARREFQYVGRDEAIHLIVLVTDGQSSVGPEPDEEGEEAAERGIQIISVGSGTLINRNLLETFADQTGGLFFEEAGETTLTSLFTHITETVAASNVVVEKRLPEGLRFKESSPQATQIELLPDGTSRAMWRLPALSLNGATTIEMEIQAVENGEWPTDISSTVTYIDFRGAQQTQGIIPVTLAAVVRPEASFVVASEQPWIVDHAIEFADTSTDGDGDVVNWEWDFGDDSGLSGEQNPTHTFSEIGEYLVSLVAMDEAGDRSDPYELAITIVKNESPVASFVVDTAGPWVVNHDIAFLDSSTDEDGEVAGWEWDFGDGYVGYEQSPVHSFSEIGDYTVSLVAIDEDGDRSEAFEVDLAIGPNQRPTAAFSVITEPPLDTINPTLFKDKSTDPDGDIVAWEWTFDDGSKSVAQNPEHLFESTGVFTVSLVAIDSDGARSKPFKQDVTVELGPRITVTREIQTCLPGDETVADAIVNVTLLVDLSGSLNGLAVVETLPEGWTFVEGHNDGATLRPVTGTTAEWLFVERLVGTETNAQREIRYSLQAPAGATGTEQVSIQGSVGSSSPRFEQPILGEDKITLREFLEIPVVISRWDTDANELALCEAEPEVIDFAEIQYAIGLWLATEETARIVPQTNNLTIDVDVMQDLIAYWLTGRSVHDSLP